MKSKEFVKSESASRLIWVYYVNEDLTFKIVQQDKQKFIIMVAHESPRFGTVGYQYITMFNGEIFKSLKSAKECVVEQAEIYLEKEF